MIQPDAKCVVNGHKVNEVIDALNPLLNMDIIVGNVAQPQIQYSSGAIQIVIPPGGGASTNEQLDIVDENNQASMRWFLTTTTQGSGGAAIASGTGTNIGSAGGKSNPAATTGDRDKLGGGIAGGPAGGKNRDNLDRAAAGGGAAPIGGGGQGGNVGAPVQIDNPQDGGRTRPGSAVAIGGRRAQPAAGDIAPEALPAAGDVAAEALPAAGDVAAEALPAAGDVAPEALPAAGEFVPEALPAAGEVEAGALPGAPMMDPGEARRSIQRGKALPSESGEINLAGMTPEEMEAAGFDLGEALPTRGQIPRSRTASKRKGSKYAEEQNLRKQKAFERENWERSAKKAAMDQDTARRQAEADRMAAMNRSGAKYSPYARGRG